MPFLTQLDPGDIIWEVNGQEVITFTTKEGQCLVALVAMISSEKVSYGILYSVLCRKPWPTAVGCV